MKRQIIKIDEEKCNGCGQCASACAEGAIQMIDGKAKLISEILCDGLGECLGKCPVDAISIEQREAEPYSEQQTMERLLSQGTKVVVMHLEHLKNHGQQKLYEEGIAVLKEKGITISERKIPLPLASGLENKPMDAQTNWPIQLQLINPASPIFDDAELIIAADCTAFSFPDFYQKFTQKKTLIIFCPKLDHVTDSYIEKLTAIFAQHSIRSMTILRMVVPCCGGTSKIVHEALRLSGKEIKIEQQIVHFDGTMKEAN